MDWLFSIIAVLGALNEMTGGILWEAVLVLSVIMGAYWAVGEVTRIVVRTLVEESVIWRIPRPWRDKAKLQTIDWRLLDEAYGMGQAGAPKPWEVVRRGDLAAARSVPPLPLWALPL